jgi:hypothetical protein
MAKLPGSKLTPWGRIFWMIQIIVAGIQELEAHERRQFREIAQRIYRERHVTAKDRKHLINLARKAGKGAARGARGGTLPGFGRR